MSKKVVANERPKDAPNTTNGGPHGGGTGEKAANFAVSGKRLVGEMRPERIKMVLAIVLCAVGVGLNVLGPKILGQATDKLLAGVVGGGMPSSITKAQAIAEASKHNPKMAEMLRNLDFTPGQGIDFGAIGSILLFVLGLYLVAFAFQLVQGWVLNGAIQRTIYRMREKVAAKIDRLPLSYFDGQPRGELLSRVTNDIDNVSQTFQQTLHQLMSSLFTLVGVLAMMFWISPTLALVALLAVPVGMVVVGVIGKRSQKLFKETWAATGTLNAHIEEAYTGHALVKAVSYTHLTLPTNREV